MSVRETAVLALVVLLAVPGVVAQEQSDEKRAEDDHNHEDPEEHHLSFYDSVEVSERGDDLVGIAGSANQGSTGRLELERRPKLRAGELVETVPGAIATQHSGGGKANQYFLRGFNLDHGTDFSVRVSGMPVNMPTHGHGQGYADLNFLIPEVVERAHYRKGPYFAEVGDFSAAGGVSFDLVRALPRGVVEATVGSYDYRQALVADSFSVAGGDLTAALEYYHYDGPWERPDGYERWNGFLSFHSGDAQRGWSLTAMGSDGEWLATDQVPVRAVDSGLIDRYGLIDSGPRGRTARFSVSGELHRGTERALTTVSAYALRYDFDLFSNFTYLLDDPENGDQFEQEDDRWVYGFDATRRWNAHLGDFHTENAVGLSLRFDVIANGLYSTRELNRIFTTRQDDVRQLGGGLWGETWVRFSPAFKVNLGLRADTYSADVDAYRSVNSGSAHDWMLSPKLTLVYRPWKNSELYINAGSGFHSNDARGATIRVDPVSGEEVLPVDPLVRAKGVDVGARSFIGSRYQTTLSVFWLELDSELLFVGDGGTTEASRPSQRIGLEWTNHWQVAPYLGLDFDATVTDASFTDDDPSGQKIPGAIVATLATGATLSDAGPWLGSVRLRYFSGGPLIEDGSVEWGPTILLNGRVGYRITHRLTAVLEGYNLLGREDDDIAYFYASRLPGEPEEGVEDVHFHPMEKPSARLMLSFRY